MKRIPNRDSWKNEFGLYKARIPMVPYVLFA